MNASDNILKASLIALFLASPAIAQGSRTDEPNMGHFYMARQQITITDDRPVVNRQSNAGAAGGGGNGALPAGGAPLPRAGWVPYSQSMPGLSTSLPKTNNGVPVKAPPQAAAPRGQRGGRMGMLKTQPAPAKAAKPAPPANAVQAYAPYKQYEPNSPASGSAAMQSNSNVQGSVLHWARHRH